MMKHSSFFVFEYVYLFFFFFFSSRRRHTICYRDWSSDVCSSDLLKVGFRVGDHAPDFELRSLDGGRVSLSELRGKPVLLNFWATWCAPCRVEMPWLVELHEKYRAQGLQIIGVSLDDSGSTQEVAALAKERGVNYQL